MSIDASERAYMDEMASIDAEIAALNAALALERARVEAMRRHGHACQYEHDVRCPLHPDWRPTP